MYDAGSGSPHAAHGGPFGSGGAVDVVEAVSRCEEEDGVASEVAASEEAGCEAAAFGWVLASLPGFLEACELPCELPWLLPWLLPWAPAFVLAFALALRFARLAAFFPALFLGIAAPAAATAAAAAFFLAFVELGLGFLAG